MIARRFTAREGLTRALHRPFQPRLGGVPSPLGSRVLAFVFLTLVEYWVAPVFLGLTNYAGLWSTIGVGLFGIWLATLTLFVFIPVTRDLRPLWAKGRHRAVFSIAWLGSIVVGLFVTNTFQIQATDPTPGPIAVGEATVYTPFGAWPTWTVDVPAIHFFGALNVEILGVLACLGFLTAALLVLGQERRAARCADPRTSATTWTGRLVSIAVWSPAGFLTGCSACTPLYLGALGLVAPGVAASGHSFLPMAPWLGFAGLLYLGSFTLAIALLRRATADPSPTGAPTPWEPAP